MQNSDWYAYFYKMVYNTPGICKEVYMVHVGKSYPIHDALGKAPGRTVYAGDMELKGLLHMAVLNSTAMWSIPFSSISPA